MREFILCVIASVARQSHLVEIVVGSKKIVDASQGIKNYFFICKDILGSGALRKQVAKDNVEQRC